MTTKKTVVAMRRCIGSKTYGIEAHDAPVSDFPIQPSQKDGLGRMCKPHWTQYTGALRKAALARKAEADANAVAVGYTPEEVAQAETEAKPAPKARRRSRVAEVLSSQEGADAVLDALGGSFAAVPEAAAE